MKMVKKLRQIPVEYRALIYRVILALLPVLVTAGWLTDELAAQVPAFLTALLGLTLAVANTPRPYRDK